VKRQQQMMRPWAPRDASKGALKNRKDLLSFRLKNALKP